MAKAVIVSELRKAIQRHLGCYTFCSKGGVDISALIDGLPVVEVPERCDSSWLQLEGFFNRVRCSSCSHESVVASPFCPNCGSEMDNYSSFRR